MQRLQVTASIRVTLALVTGYLDKETWIMQQTGTHQLKIIEIHTIYINGVPPLSVLGLRVAYLCNLILLLPWVFQTLQTRKM